MRLHRGYTLIEVMITVAIVAILAAIALPSYSEYIMRSRITDATSALAGMRVKMEQYFQDNRTYVGACAANTVAPLPANTANFTFSCPTLTAAAYQVNAAGAGSMTGFTYTINQSNARATPTVPTGWTSSTTCWVLKKNGSC
jgi:type IV pilus assembly protein PilE